MNHFHSLKVIISLNNCWFNFTVSNSNFLFFKLINLMLHPSFNMCKFRLLWYICWLHRPYFTFLTQFLVRQKIIYPCLFFIMYICVIFVVFSFFITLLNWLSWFCCSLFRHLYISGIQYVLVYGSHILYILGSQWAYDWYRVYGSDKLYILCLQWAYDLQVTIQRWCYTIQSVYKMEVSIN